MTAQSGRSKNIRIRHQCQKDFRNALHLWTFQTTKYSEWARAFYAHARKAGQGHALALRNLGRKWLRILYRMWRERKLYEEGRYLAALIRHGSSLVKEIQQLQPLTTGG